MRISTGLTKLIHFILKQSCEVFNIINIESINKEKCMFD